MVRWICKSDHKTFFSALLDLSEKLNFKMCMYVCMYVCRPSFQNSKNISFCKLNQFIRS